MCKPLSLALWMGLMAIVQWTVIAQPTDSLQLCTSGNTASQAPTGVLYDSGGPDGNYTDLQSCSLLINPGCAITLTLFVDYFFSEPCCDRLAIYDGENEQAPLVATLSGYLEDLTFSSSSGQFFLQWFSDGSVIERGFRLEWSSELAPPEPVEAVVSVSNSAPALQEQVQFSASATNYPVSWSWDFGNGVFSSQQNPFHNYSQPGSYTAQLVVVNCHGLRDTAEINIQVQGAPVLGYTPGSIDLSVSCGDTAFARLGIGNTGAGPLLFQADATLGHIPKVVVYARNASSSPLDGLLSALAASGVEHSLMNSLAQDASQLSEDLMDADVLILPETYQDFPTTQSLAPAVQAFAARGGSVIFLAQGYYQYWMESTGLLNAPDYYTQQYSYFNLDFTEGHPLTLGMPALYFAPTYCGGLRISNSDYFSLCDQNGYSILGYRQQGRSRIIYLGFNFLSYDNTTAQLLGNAITWSGSRGRLSVTPAVGQMAIGDSLELDLEIYTEFLPAGVYNGQVSLSSNDPMQPEIAIPLHLMIEGTPAAETATTSIPFGITQQYAQAVRQFVVHNPGCDTLHFLASSMNNTNFLLLPLPDLVLPWQSAVLKVAYAPQAPGSHTGQLILETDGGALTIQLTGLAVAAPISVASPESISASLSCDESFNQTITVSNNGMGTLNLQVGGAQAPKRILGLTYGANIWKWSVLRNLMETYLSNAEIREYAGGSVEALDSALAWSTVLVLPPFDVFSDPVYDAFRPTIQEYLNNGGQVLVMGWYNTGPITQMGVLPTFYTNAYFDFEVVARIPAHAILEGMGSRFRTGDYGYFANFDADGLVRLADYNGELYLGYRPVGQGNVVYWGASLDNSVPENSNLLLNLFRWMANPLPPGASISAASGVLTTGGTQELSVEFNGEGLPAGLYTGQLRINTNDPVNNPLIISVQVEALGFPCIHINYTVPPCSGKATFEEETINSLSSWYWSFGDGFDSFEANPEHTYTQSGAYTVTLVGCNNVGCDTAVQEIIIDPFYGPTDANCIPQTLDYCCEAGIFRVQLAELDHASGNASEGYQNLSCNFGATLMAGSQYPITIITGNQAEEHVRVWADLNGDGSFGANELLFSSQAFTTHQGFVTIPTAAVRDIPLRLRVASEPYYYAPPIACGPINRGQVEDYYIVVQRIVATHEPVGSLSATVSPNPSSAEAQLEMTLEEPAQVLVNIAGQAGALQTQPLKFSGRTGVNRWPLPALPEGLYFITVRTGRGYAVLQWVNMRQP